MAELEGTDLRNVIADDYQKAAARTGAPIPREDAERLAAADLALVDRLEADPGPASPPETLTPGPSLAEASDPTEAEEMARAFGGKLVVRDVPNESAPTPVVETLSRESLEKRQKLLRRVKELMRTNCTKQHRHVRSCWEYKDFAPLVMRIHADWNTCRGVFAQAKNQRERDSRFFVLMERVCDSSNGHPGLPAWYFK